MTAAEWNTGNAIEKMLEQLEVQLHVALDACGRRKLRLFACASCRRVWDHLSTVERHTVEVAEQFADGICSTHTLGDAYLSSVRQSSMTRSNSAQAASRTAHRSSRVAARAHQFAASLAPLVNWDDWLGERGKHCHLLRDIFGNPFRPAVIDPAWLRWHDATIPCLAQQMYDARDFAALPILADALEEAGCTDGDLLGHCRGPGPHVRGCWVLVAVLGKG